MRAMARNGLAAVAATCIVTGAAAQQDITTLSLEQLLDVEVYSASKFGQRVSDAPAAVDVITAEDIKLQGARTLADVLKLVPGFFTFSDRQYQYAGIRGFGPPGDYNSRMLLLYDGYRANDPLYDGAGLGTEGSLDVDLIDRVEIIRGPASSVYGSNAVLAVVNVVTRRFAGNAVEVSGEAGSGSYGKARGTVNREFGNGAQLMLSLTGFRSLGKDLYFPEFDTPNTNNGVAQGQDFDRGHQVFGRFSFEGLTFTTIMSKRTHGYPAAPYGMEFNNPNNQFSDDYAFYNVDYQRRLTEATDVTLRLFGGSYNYNSAQVTDYPPPTRNLDTAHGRWWGTEAKVVAQVSPRNKFVAGVETQNTYRAQQNNSDEVPPLNYMDINSSVQRYGIYVQDEFAIRPELALTAGVRYDTGSNFEGRASPRLAAVYRSSPATVWKLLYGHAFRAPNVYELYYQYPGNQVSNSALQPERVRTLEGVWEHFVTADSRIALQAYHYEVSQLIRQGIDAASGLSQFQNVGQVGASGMEAQYEQIFRNRARLRASISAQRARDDNGTTLTNSPHLLAKLDASTPLPLPALRLGFNAQYVSWRRTDTGGTVGGYPLAGLTLLHEDPRRRWEASASIYNLFDRHYRDPVIIDPSVARDSMAQDGRGFRVKLLLRY